MSLSSRPRANILGVQVNVITMSQAVAAIDDWVRSRTAAYVCITPAHGIHGMPA